MRRLPRSATARDPGPAVATTEIVAQVTGRPAFPGPVMIDNHGHGRRFLRPGRFGSF